MRRTRAGKMKSALYEITKKLALEGSNSRKVVDQLKVQYKDIISKEQEDILDLGLMVLAGRVAVKATDEPLYPLLFGEEPPREFLSLEFEVDGKVSKQRFSCIDIPMETWERRRVRQPTSHKKRKSDEEIIQEKFEDMKALGAGEHETIRTFYKKK